MPPPFVLVDVVLELVVLPPLVTTTVLAVTVFALWNDSALEAGEP